MANPEHVVKLLEGVKAWNAWRDANPDIVPDLENADLTECAVRGTSLHYVNHDYQTAFTHLAKVNLATANLKGTKLQGANLWGANLEEAILESADLRRANLQDANLRRAKLDNAKMQRAHLVLACLTNASLANANLRRAYLSQADIRQANLKNANLREADFFAANLQKADISQATLVRAYLLEADLQGADLCTSNLAGADMMRADLRGTDLRVANLRLADVDGVKFGRSSLQQCDYGIRVDGCYGNQIFKTFAQDQDYVEELRRSGKKGWLIFWIWWLFADCGRSLLRWACWSIGFALAFAFIYCWMGAAHFRLDHLPFKPLSMLYYSVVTFTTLGFGDIKPASDAGMLAVMAEVILGYVMLGGLISILANKLARRS